MANETRQKNSAKKKKEIQHPKPPPKVCKKQHKKKKAKNTMIRSKSANNRIGKVWKYIRKRDEVGKEERQNATKKGKRRKRPKTKNRKN